MQQILCSTVYSSAEVITQQVNALPFSPSCLLQAQAFILKFDTNCN